MKASDLMVIALEEEGVKHMFGVPGEENLDLLESLRLSSINFITTRDERSAGFMAATVGRLTGKAGIALSTLGPGATNFVTPIAYAQLGAMPAIFITGQKPLSDGKQGAFQIVKTNDVVSPLTKLTKQIINPNSIPAIVRESFRVAEEERPGAVHIELPEDVAGQDATPRIFPVTNVRRPLPEDKAIARAVELIEKAWRPLILVGAGANRKRAAKTLTALIGKTGIPFFTTQMGKGVIDERHKQYLGTAALSSNDYLHCAIQKADLIINFGHDIVEKPPFLMGGKGPRVIHVNFESAQVDDIYAPELEVLGDLANAAWQICERVEVQKHWDFAPFYRVKEVLEKEVDDQAKDERFPLTPQRIVREVGESLPKDGIISLDNGMYKIWFARNHKVLEPNTLLLDNALATMGAGLPAAIAAKIVQPNVPVVAVVGDGGFMMTVGELETAKRLKLDLAVVVINDNGYGMIKWKQDAEGFGDFGLSFGNPDFIELAESFGARGHKVTRAGELSVFLKTAQENGGLHIIEVPIDYSENDRVLNRGFRENICPV
jgi:acetolactate synthase I/II/III large subunit